MSESGSEVMPSEGARVVTKMTRAGVISNREVDGRSRGVGAETGRITESGSEGVDALG